MGQSCTVQIDGANNSVAGHDHRAGRHPDRGRVGHARAGVRSRSTRAEIEVPDLDGADGSAVSITVVDQQVNNALTVPIAAVKQNGVGADVVRVIDLAHGGRVTEVPVTTGLTEGSYIQITRACTPGQTVIVEVDQAQ